MCVHRCSEQRQPPCQRGVEMSRFATCRVLSLSMFLVSATIGSAAQAPPQPQHAADLGFSRPAISPDGTSLAFVFQSSIWVVPIEGGTARMLVKDSLGRQSPVWSPDGRHIACIATDAEVRHFSLQILNVNPGAIARDLWKTDHEIRGTIDWSPNGKDIAFVLGPEDAIHTISTEGGNPTSLNASGMHPRWSPDGSAFAYQRASNQDVWITELSNTQSRRLATDVSVKSSFAWSPDGKDIVYESLDRESVDLWKVSATGGRARPLTSDIAIEQGPRWHPNNGQIYFSHRRRIWRVDSRGGRMEVVPVRCPTVPQPAAPAIALKNVSIVDVRGGSVLPPQDILLSAGRIQSMGTNLAIPAHATVVDGSGLFAVPGLIDMHVHYEPWMGAYFLRYGVSRILECGSGEGLDHILALGDEIKAGMSRGPLAYQTGSVMNGSGIPGPPGLGGIQSNDPAVIRAAVEWHLQEGIDIVKIGSENTPATLDAILDVAHRNGRRVLGHIALVPALQAIDMGQDGIEHPRGMGWAGVPSNEQPKPIPRQLPGMWREAAAWRDLDPQLVQQVVERMVAKHVIWDPTLGVWALGSHPAGISSEQEYQNLPAWIRERFALEMQSGFIRTWDKSDFDAYGAGLPAMRNMVGRFFRAGGIITAGSDGGVPGLSLHRELAELSRSGLPPADCLRAATLNAAKSLRRESELGTIEAGKLADVILIRRNPLEDPGALMDVLLTIQEGRVVFDNATARNK